MSYLIEFGYKLEKASTSDADFVEIIRLTETMLGMSDRDLAEQLQVSLLTVERWKINRYLPHPLMRSGIYEFLSERTQRSKYVR